MKKGDKVIIQSTFSYNGEQCEVIIVDIKEKEFLVYIKYPDGYLEWMPTSVFN
jgi:hypothetical protein